MELIKRSTKRPHGRIDTLLLQPPFLTGPFSFPIAHGMVFVRLWGLWWKLVLVTRQTTGHRPYTFEQAQRSFSIWIVRASWYRYVPCAHMPSLYCPCACGVHTGIVSLQCLWWHLSSHKARDPGAPSRTNDAGLRPSSPGLSLDSGISWPWELPIPLRKYSYFPTSGFLMAINISLPRCFWDCNVTEYVKPQCFPLRDQTPGWGSQNSGNNCTTHKNCTGFLKSDFFFFKCLSMPLGYF